MVRDEDSAGDRILKGKYLELVMIIKYGYQMRDDSLTEMERCAKFKKVPGL